MKRGRDTEDTSGTLAAGILLPDSVLAEDAPMLRGMIGGIIAATLNTQSAPPTTSSWDLSAGSTDVSPLVTVYPQTNAKQQTIRYAIDISLPVHRTVDYFQAVQACLTIDELRCDALRGNNHFGSTDQRYVVHLSVWSKSVPPLDLPLQLRRSTVVYHEVERTEPRQGLF
jgi:hypothetical protein